MSDCIKTGAEDFLSFTSTAIGYLDTDKQNLDLNRFCDAFPHLVQVGVKEQKIVL